MSTTMRPRPCDRSWADALEIPTDALGVATYAFRLLNSFRSKKEISLEDLYWGCAAIADRLGDLGVASQFAPEELRIGEPTEAEQLRIVLNRIAAFSQGGTYEDLARLIRGSVEGLARRFPAAPPWACNICLTENPAEHLCCKRCGWDHSNPTRGLPLAPCPECGGVNGRHSERCSGYPWDADR